MEKIKLLNNEDKEFEILSINQNSKLLMIEFPELIDLSELDTSSIDLYTANGVKCTLKPIVGYDTIYKIEGNTVTLSNDGSIYVEPTIPDPTDEVPIEPEEPYEPTEEELALQLENSKIAKIKESILKLESFLSDNPLLFVDGNYYSVTMEKQSLLTSALALYDLKLKSGIDPIFKWNSTGDTCVEMPIESGIALAIAIGDYVEPIVEQQRIFEKRIRECVDVDELNKVVIYYEIKTTD